MFRLCCALIIIPLLAAGVSGAQEQSLMLQAEYRRDSIDYNDRVRDFTREKIFLGLNRHSSINLALLTVHHDHEQRFTWNLVLKDVPPGLSMLIGNYTVNFGSGMMMGKKKIIPSDPFTGKLIVSRDRAFTPARSGNPVYSFSGMACEGRKSWPGFAATINFFTSMRERHAPVDDYESCRLGSSLNTIAQRVISAPNHTEHIYIRDLGLMADFDIWGCVDIQAYACYTDLLGTGMRRMLWSWDGERGERAVSCFGLFFQYSDDCVRFFIECARPVIRVRTGEASESSIGDWGALSGIKLRHPHVITSVTAKATGKEFFAPYASGEHNPENAWDFTNVFILSGKLRAGASLSGEKRMVPARYGDVIPSERREMVSARYRLKRGGLLRLDIGRVSSEEEAGTLQRERAGAYLALRLCEQIRAAVTSKVKKDMAGAVSCQGGVAVNFELSGFKLRVDFSRYYIEGSNYMYARILPFRDAVTPGMFIRETSSLVTARLILPLNNALFSFRGQLCRSSDGVTDRRMEVYGRGSW